ncbi:MAG TPA: sodium/proline symporter [Candidatus Poseidoniaceae archaeon]|nr:sodium/proline symporter [Candidatus Poseidoniaceae archaeon]
MEIWILISFLFFLGIFAGVGLASMRVKEDTTDDYLVAGRGMHPALAALSAVSTWNSGYMFIGAVGFTYMMGYNVIWMAIASTLGQLIAWAWLYKFIQEEGQKRSVRSLSSLVAEKAGAPEAKLAAILSVLFLSIYAAAQLTSGGKALFVMLGWDELIGILIGFVLVVAYCYAGGIRASIWTDAVQSCVMIVGSLILCWIALGEVGGFGGLNAGLLSQDPALTSMMPPNLMFGFSMWVLAFFLGGLAVAGQPQVVSRIMTLDSDNDRKQAMVWFFVWQTPFIVLITFIGLASRVLFSSNDFDPELGLPMLAMDTMPAIGVGMILASIFAATMSTADSQVLACTAAITDDIKPEWREDHKTTKKVTLVVAAFATAISVGGLYIPGGDSVFKLVVLAVYGLGSIFVPLLIIRWMGYKPDSTHSIAMMISAFSAVVVWSLLPAIMDWKSVSGADGIFPSVPGMGAAFATHFAFCWFRSDSSDNPFGRFAMPSRKVATWGAVILLAVVGGMEGSYQKFAPGAHSLNRDSSGYQLNYSVIQNIQSETVNIGDGETYQSTFEVLETSNALISVSFIISYGETNEALGSECDDVITVPDFSDVNGPHDQIDDNPRTTSSCGQDDIEVAWVKTNADGFYQAEVGVGEYSKEGTNGDLTSVREGMLESYRMEGIYSVDVTVETNTEFQLTNDPSESITISWVTLEFMPEEVKKA